MSVGTRWLQLSDKSWLNINQVVQFFYVRRAVEGKSHHYQVQSFLVDSSRRQHDFISKIWDYAKIHGDRDIYAQKSIQWCHEEAFKRIEYTTQFIVKVDDLIKDIWERWIDNHHPKHKTKKQDETSQGAVQGYYGDKETEKK